MKRVSDKLSILFLGYIYAFVMLYSMASILYQDVPILRVVIFSFAAYVVMNLILSFKITRMSFFALILLSAIATGILYLTHSAKFITEQLESIGTYCVKVYYSDFIDINAATVQTSAATLLGLLSILAAVVVFVLFNRYFRFFILTGITIAAQLFAWIMTGIENKIIFAVICVLTIIAYIRHVYEKKVKSGLITDTKVSGSLMLFSIPAAIIPIILIMLIPKNDLPIQWPWLDQKILKVIEFVEQRFSYTNIEFFSLSTTGFNGRSERLGGPVRPSNTIVMDVTAEKRTYLRGAAYTWYEDNSWSQIKNDQMDVISSRTNERELEENRQGFLNIPVEGMFTDLNEDDAVLLENFASGRFNGLLFPTYSMDVKYRNMTTRSIFIPLMTLMPIRDGGGSIIPISENLHGVVIANDKLPSGSTYQLSYAQPMYGEPMLKKALTYSRVNLYRDSLTELYKQRNALIQSDPSLATEADDSDGNVLINSIDRKIDAISTLYDSAIDIEFEYTRLSDTIPERVKTLALDITKDCTNQYEKVISIENYLRDNYQYTMNPSRIPQGQDFVDWFLFEDKKGYCTYYATAMTLMLRYNDIPARYVEGYVLPVEHSDKDVYTVSNRNAHAWVEVYFEGFGWLSFEPTAAFAGIMNFRATSDEVYVINNQMPDLEELMKRYANRTDIPGYIPIIPGNGPEWSITAYLKFMPYAVGGFILFMIAINLLAALFGRLYMSRLKNKKKVIRYYQLMLKWLENSGYVIKVGESVIEFSKRIDKVYSFDHYDFEETSLLFSKVRYGDKDVTSEEIKMIQNIAKQLKKIILKELGLKRYLPLRCIILGM